jgi:hypothetical protein
LAEEKAVGTLVLQQDQEALAAENHTVAESDQGPLAKETPVEQQQQGLHRMQEAVGVRLQQGVPALRRVDQRLATAVTVSPLQ